MNRELKPSAEAWEILENCLRAWGMNVPDYMNDTVTAVAAAAAIDRGLARARGELS